MAYYLGIDGGGSKTTCAVGDETSLLAEARAGASNIVRVGEIEAVHSLHEAVRQACAAAGISPQQVERACVGAAGAARPQIAALVGRALAEIIPAPIDVIGDIQIALSAAFDDGPGIVVIAGTGSVAYGRNTHGNTARAGGWGFAVSDEGSAHWIGRTAISSVLRTYDRTGKCRERTNPEDCASENSENRNAGSPNLPLLNELLKVWQISGVDNLVRAANATPSPDFSALFPAVLECAEAGDKLSTQVLTSAGLELANIVALIIPQLFGHCIERGGIGSELSTDSPSSEEIGIGMVGGVFRHSGLVRQVFGEEIRHFDARAEIMPQIVEPVIGALRLARRRGDHFR